MGLLWVAVTLRPAGQGLGWAVPAYLALAFVCLVLAVIAAATGLLPNRSTYPAFPVVAGLLLAASLGLGELGRLGRGLLAAASVGGLFPPLALLSPHGMEVGDVKLAPTLGLALGWLSRGTVAVGMVLDPAVTCSPASSHRPCVSSSCPSTSASMSSSNTSFFLSASALNFTNAASTCSSVSV